jgi:hypothetical protein
MEVSMEERYYLYQMLNKTVEAQFPVRFGGKGFHGLVTKVYRDVLDGHIHIVVNDEHMFVLREPTRICQEGDNIVFVYGGESEATDEEFFDELMNTSSRGAHVDSVLQSLEIEEKTIVRFRIVNVPRRIAQSRERRKSRIFRKLMAKSGIDRTRTEELLAATG